MYTFNEENIFQRCSSSLQLVWGKKKEKFSQLQICKVILCVIRKLHQNATDEQISTPVKIWLAHAKERMGREKEQNIENQE
ncbi:unnamed protein product [Lasius platythorax]|uniref:Uncharacterized protein n=1 Tax=Lasius platythorax TaxID=488582 RepID=A0AAV2P9W8_9HYME